MLDHNDQKGIRLRVGDLVEYRPSQATLQQLRPRPRPWGTVGECGVVVDPNRWRGPYTWIAKYPTAHLQHPMDRGCFVMIDAELWCILDEDIVKVRRCTKEELLTHVRIEVRRIGQRRKS